VLLFLLAIKAKKNVAYHPMNLSFTYFFTWTGTEYDISDFFHALGAYTKVILMGMTVGMHWIMIYSIASFYFSSPRSTNYKEFVKEDGLKVYLNS
jgi:hypothetical protein